MSGINQHFLPRFLLKGFYSRTRGKEIYTFVYKKNSIFFETNINNIGSSRYFYGKAGENSLDSKITDLEINKFSPLLEELRKEKKTTRINNIEIPKFIAHLSVRTKHIRDSVYELLTHPMEKILLDMQNPLFTKQFLPGIMNKHPEIINDELKKYNCPEDVKLLLKQTIITYAPIVLNQKVEVISKEINHLNKKLIKMAPNFSQASHVRALDRDLIPKHRMKLYKKFIWFLFFSNHENIILGDVGCIFKNIEQPNFNSFGLNKDRIENIYLPISCKHLLIGSISKLTPEINIEEINRAIVSCSKEFFISSENSERNREYTNFIGSNSQLIPESEIDRVIEKIYSEYIDLPIESIPHNSKKCNYT